jgi:DNA-binding Xre family transcriptional regulator
MEGPLMQSTRLRAIPDEQSLQLGALLCRLRVATVVSVDRATGRRGGGIVRYVATLPLSQAELARRAGLDTAVISRLEAGTYGRVTRATLDKVVAALNLDDVSAARLLIAAGYWPWQDLDEDTAVLVAQTALAIVAGDYRPVRLGTLAQGKPLEEVSR